MTNYSSQSRPSLLTRYARFATTINHWQSLPLLIIRLYFGYQCAQAGIRHLETFNLTATRFAYWRIPFPLVSSALAGAAETIGGFLLYLGLFSRPVAFVLMINFFMTMFVVNLSAANFSISTVLQNVWSDQDYLFKDNSFPFFAATAVIFFFGPGWVSVDGLFRFWSERKAAASEPIPEPQVAATDA